MIYIHRWMQFAVISMLGMLVQPIVVTVSNFVMLHVIYFTTLQLWNLS